MKYNSPWWLLGGHAQTIMAAKCAKKPKVMYFRERWATPDGDFLDLDFTAPSSDNAKFDSLWVLFHGLEGSSSSHYSLALMQRAKERKVLGVVVHFRGCSGESNQQPRAYHSGDSAEVDWVLRRLASRFSQYSSRHAIGVSLGGNVLLKWLGEQGAYAFAVISSAVAVSAPVDLHAGAVALSKGFNRVYTKMFLSTLIPKSIEKIKVYPKLGNERQIQACRNFFDFDNAVTAPWHGFDNALDYYAQSSSKYYLAHIGLPTLMINALNDPFMPGQFLPKSHEVSSFVQQIFTSEGGHVGFASASGLGLGLEWLPNVCQSFFDSSQRHTHG